MTVLLWAFSLQEIRMTAYCAHLMRKTMLIKGAPHELSSGAFFFLIHIYPGASNLEELV